MPFDVDPVSDWPVIDATVATGRRAQTSRVPDPSAFAAVARPPAPRAVFADPPGPEQPETAKVASAAAIAPTLTREVVVMSGLRCPGILSPSGSVRLGFPYDARGGASNGFACIFRADIHGRGRQPADGPRLRKVGGAGDARVQGHRQASARMVVAGRARLPRHAPDKR